MTIRSHSDFQLFEIPDELKTLQLVCDTREQNTILLRRRLEAIGLPVLREKLNFADYSCKTEHFDFTRTFAIERKMSIDEIAQNFTHGRERFAREFERAKSEDAKIYILIENGSWESIYGGKYRTRIHPNALVASLLTWEARYGATVQFCRSETTPLLIRDVLLREARHELERIALEGCG